MTWSWGVGTDGLAAPGLEDVRREGTDETRPERDVSFRRRVQPDADDSELFECVGVSESMVSC